MDGFSRKLRYKRLFFFVKSDGEIVSKHNTTWTAELQAASQELIEYRHLIHQELLAPQQVPLISVPHALSSPPLERP